MAIEHADFEGIERLALVTGGEIVSTFDRPDLVKLGHCKLIEEVMIGMLYNLLYLNKWGTSSQKALNPLGTTGCLTQFLIGSYHEMFNC